jgi:hypothetical protein
VAAAICLCVALAVLATTVTGTIRDSVTNALIQGLKAGVTQQSILYATTNSLGACSITKVATSTINPTTSKAAYITQVTGDLTVPGSATVTALLILLVKMDTI